MNNLLFSALGFAFLFSLKKEGAGPQRIIEETFQIFSCATVLAAAALLFGKHLSLQKEELAVGIIPIVFVLCSLTRRPALIFISICGLALPFLDPAAENSLTGILTAAALFAGFRLLMLGFQERTLFFRPPAFFSGIPVLLVQAFWASLLLTAWALMPYLKG